MLNKMIQWSLANRAVVLAVSILVMVMGIRTATELPVEVLPDLTKPTVVILVEAPGLSPEEVESQITVPLESSMMGVAGLTRLRSNSDVSLALIYAEFDWGTDIYKARVLVQERLQSAREKLPEGIEPFMTPVSSLMGEILLVGVRSTVPEGEEGLARKEGKEALIPWEGLARGDYPPPRAKSNKSKNRQTPKKRKNRKFANFAICSLCV